VILDLTPEEVDKVVDFLHYANSNYNNDADSGLTDDPDAAEESAKQAAALAFKIASQAAEQRKGTDYGNESRGVSSTGNA